MHGKRFPGRGVETLKLEVGRKTNDGRRALRPGGGDVCPDHPVKGFRACSNSGFQHPAQGAGIPFHGMPPTEVASFTSEGDDDWESSRIHEDAGQDGHHDGFNADQRGLSVPVQTVPFVPIFILGGIFLIAPGMIVTLFTNSDPLGFAVVMATAIAALIRPTASWMLFAVLCSMRTVPFIVAALTAVAMKIGLAKHGLPYLIAYIVIGGVAQLRIRSLRRSGEIDI